MTSLRPAILSYVKEKYKSEIEYLWYRYPNYAVFRHDDNKKWYGIVMDVARNKLGLPGDGTVDVLNVKVDDFLLRDLLIRRDGFLAGYHISRGNWITVLLDGTVTLEEIKGLIDISFEATASKKKKKEIKKKLDKTYGFVYDKHLTVAQKIQKFIELTQGKSYPIETIQNAIGRYMEGRE